MDNKIIKMQVEILDLNKVEQYKEMLKNDSISYYEDFLLDNIVFIEVENKIKTEIEKDSRFEVHMGHIAYPSDRDRFEMAGYCKRCGYDTHD